MLPLIGITSSRYSFPNKWSGPSLLGTVLSDDYAHGVEVAGGIPVQIPMYETVGTAAKLADALDGLLLAGGDDVDPNRFGEQPRYGLGSVTPERDTLEFALVEEMLARKKPIFGICRGMQVLNAALGGTLYQDLAREWRGNIQHSQKARRNFLSHKLHVEPGSRVYELLGQRTEVFCNSFHHQAVKTVAPDLVAVAWDDEGLVEAFEHPDYNFLVAVQWHPENLWRTAPEHHGLFRGFVESARKTAEA